MFFKFNITTADKIRRIPNPDITVKGSEKTIIPITVATIGSIVAIIPALLASTLLSPRVYARNGITAVIKAVRQQNKIRNPKSAEAENFENISIGRHITQEPAAAKINVYVVTVYGEYFLNAIVPKILYNPYPIPEPRPTNSPVIVIPSPEIPDTRTQPAKARAKAINLFLLNFS
jgi:hypothetical protein